MRRCVAAPLPSRLDFADDNVKILVQAGAPKNQGHTTRPIVIEPLNQSEIPDTKPAT
jgi:hypothetical protein